MFSSLSFNLKSKLAPAHTLNHWNTRILMHVMTLMTRYQYYFIWLCGLHYYYAMLCVFVLYMKQELSQKIIYFHAYGTVEHISNISSYALVNDYFQSRFFFVSFFESLEFWSFGAQTHDKSTLIYRCTYTHSKSAILLTSNQIKCTHPYGNFIDSCRNR